VTKEISVFVDESGSFAPDGVDICAPYYLLCMVFHDQSSDIALELSHLSDALVRMGLPREHAIHAGPLIRREEDYVQMSRQERIGIFRRLMIFMQKIDFKYRCFKVYKPYTTTLGSIRDELLRFISDFLVVHRTDFDTYREIKVYYDDGQSQVTSLLRESFALFSSKTTFIPHVVPSRYRLFQVADAICTLELAKAKLADKGSLSNSEERFFGGVKFFRKAYIKPIERKEWR